MRIFSPQNRLILCLIALFTLLNIPSALAAFGLGPFEDIKCKALGLIDPAKAVMCIFKKYGIDDAMITENAQYLNVASLKKPHPQVTVTFTPTDPKPGEKATATATPLNFANQPETLYYTWYLQPEICQEKNLNAENKAR
ncbi:MAG: hypothetical protein CO140_01860, partial [Candidatus Moranbacteria bacterium CG_4_9_14_3_um_filter_40_7]